MISADQYRAWAVADRKTLIESLEYETKQNQRLLTETKQSGGAIQRKYDELLHEVMQLRNIVRSRGRDITETHESS